MADIYPSANLLPKDPVLRAKARFFIEKLNTVLVPAWDDFPQREGSKEPFLAVLDVVQSLLPETGFVVGEWSIADASIAPFIGRAEVALREDFGAWQEGEGPVAYKEVFEGERFGRLAQYWRNSKARESWKTFDEVRRRQQPEIKGDADILSRERTSRAWKGGSGAREHRW